MDRVKRLAPPLLALAAIAAGLVALLPARPDAGTDGPRTQAGANQPAATEAGALSNLCAGWGRARLDCAAFVNHFLATRAEQNPALAAACTPPPAALAEWTIATLRETPASAPWAPALEAALAPGPNAHPLPCPPPAAAAAPAQKAEPT